MVLGHLIVSFHCRTHMQLFIKMYPYESLTPMSETTLALGEKKKEEEEKEEDEEEEEKARIL